MVKCLANGKVDGKGEQRQNKSESKVKRQSGKSITFSKLPNANDGLR